MDLQWLVPVTGLLGAIGTGVGFLISRADKRREAREGALIATLKEIIAELKGQKRRLERKVHMLRRTAGSWREQLIRHNITPDPEEWPEDPEDDEH